MSVNLVVVHVSLEVRLVSRQDDGGGGGGRLQVVILASCSFKSDSLFQKPQAKRRPFQYNYQG